MKVLRGSLEMSKKIPSIFQVAPGVITAGRMTLKLRHFYEFGPFRLEPDEQLLLSNSQPVPIAPKYFELLVFLVQNCGRLVTKDQIMQTVWSGSFVEEANLTVAVSAIRKALGDKDANIRYIETV